MFLHLSDRGKVDIRLSMKVNVNTCSGVTVSIVFLNYNRLNETRITVEKLLKCKEVINDLEIIAVDNGSTDGTGEYLSQISGKIKTILLERNSGIAGYNKGFEIAKGNVIIVLDDDSHIEAGTILRVVDTFQNARDIGIIAFKIVDKSGLRFNTWHIPPDDTYRLSFAFVGCGFAIRRDVFREIGFYPAGFFLYHNEIAVAVKTRLLGYKIVYDPLCVAVHRTEGQPRDPSRRIYYTLKNSLMLTWMYYPSYIAIYMTLSRIMISFSLAVFHGKFGIAIKAILDFLSSFPDRTILSRKQRISLIPFFYQNSIFHRIFSKNK